MDIADQLQATTIRDSCCAEILGSIRINPKCHTDAFITDPEGGPDIYIEGPASKRLALEGDIVRVRLRPSVEWKLNLNTIASRWDEWSKDLSVIVDEIERSEAAADLSKVDSISTSHSKVDNSGKTSQANSNWSPRVKRNIDNSSDIHKKSKTNLQSKLPSNLPSGISKLRIEHIANLPFYSECVQKTGTVIEVVKQNHSRVAGGVLKHYSDDHALFSPLDSRVPRMLIDIRECPLDFGTTNRYSDVIFVAKMNGWDRTSRFGIGNLVKLVGNSNCVNSRIRMLLMEHQVYDTDFPSDVYDQLSYLSNLPDNWFEENSKNRLDLTNECVFTIDPKTARDLDDAVSIRSLGDDLYEVGVHIADVSHFVEEMTAVDYYARLRTTSVYLVDRVVPMLPKPLCENMCSLNAGEPKLTFSVIWKMDGNGYIIEEWFGKTLIKSCVKLAYENAQDLIDKSGDVSWIEEGVNMPKLHAFDWQQVSTSVLLLNKIATSMRIRRFESGALKIDQVKLKFELDPSSGSPTGFTFENRTEANYLIEEFMLQANMSVAKRIYMFSRDNAFLRRHPASSAQVLKDVKEFCDAKGYPMDIESAGSIQSSLNAITDQTIGKVVSFLLLKAMKNAEYVCTGALSSDDPGHRHFALNVSFYTHFTSPIRRYADVIVHRQLALALGYNQNSNEDIDTLTLMALECTKRKISAKKISETSQKLYFNLFVKKSGHCELLACVTRIHDQSFDVILVDYSQTGRVYLDKIKDDLTDFKFENFSGVKRLVLLWKINTEKKRKKKAKKGQNAQPVDEDQANYRDCLGSKNALGNKDLIINEAKFDQEQIIQVFDVIRVIVSVDSKDISKLNLELKKPEPDAN